MPEDEPQLSGLPPVQAPPLASTSKTMWPPAGASFSATVPAIPPHGLPPNDIPQPPITTVNP